MKICNLELKSYRQFLREQKLPEESDAILDVDDPEEN